MEIEIKSRYTRMVRKLNENNNVDSGNTDTNITNDSDGDYL